MTAPIDPAAFTPAPVAPRRDGWTAERQRAFILALSELGCVSDACAAVGISPRSAYRLRLRPGAEGFDKAWEAALSVASRRLAGLAFERAVHGRVRAVRWKGEVVGEERVPSDTMLKFLLKHLDPMRFGALSGFSPKQIRDPRVTAGTDLARTLARLHDIDEPAGLPTEADAAAPTLGGEISERDTGSTDTVRPEPVEALPS